MKITYIFVTGRKNRIEKIQDYAKEMFYGYDYFSKKYQDTHIIELTETNTRYSNLFGFIDKVINKISKLPFNMKPLTNKKNINLLKNSDYVVATNDRLALSSLPMLIYSKFKNKNINFTFFVMGLLEAKKINLFQKITAKFLLKVLFKFSDNLIFLGENEYQRAIKLFPKYKNKFHFHPFMIDFDFWSLENNTKKKDGILFVGNDSNREFEKVLKIAKILKHINFTFVTKYFRLHNTEINLSNVKVIDGSWGNQKISDEELRLLYSESKLVILPLKNSIQPSGQSVALQSMCLNTPVMISETDGFWDNKNFRHKKNIMFVQNNNLDNWIREINELYNNDKLLNEVSSNAFEVIKKTYTQDIFMENLFNIMNLDNTNI